MGLLETIVLVVSEFYSIGRRLEGIDSFKEMP
jgi:hypothetical protein